MGTPMKLVDVEVTVGFACDGTLTWEEIKQFVEDAVQAKMDACAEMEDWGGGPCRYYPNGEGAVSAHLASAL